MRPSCKRDDARGISSDQSLNDDVERIRFGLECVESGSDILRTPNFERRNNEADRTSVLLDGASLQHGLG
jgi:hypothetical protein